MLNNFTLQRQSSSQLTVPSLLAVGIDPGLRGAIVAINQDSEILGKYVMPLYPGGRRVDFHQLCGLINGLSKKAGNRIIVCLEENHGRAPQSLGTASRMVWNNAPIWGMFIGMNIRHLLVKPQIWQKDFHKGIGDTIAPKNTKPELLAKIKSLHAARQLWPADNLKPDSASSRGQAHDGVVDALLMAEYGRMTHLRGGL